MKKIQLYSVIACAALTLFCGCFNQNQSSDSSLTAEITTVSESPVTSTASETTASDTTITTSIETTITTASSTVVSTTKPDVTTVTTTEARVYEHHYEIMNTAFRTLPVNDRCMKLYEENPDEVPEMYAEP